MANEAIAPRLVKVEEGARYAGLGMTKFRQWASEIGAVCRFGRAVRYDLHVIDKELDKMKKDSSVAE